MLNLAELSVIDAPGPGSAADEISMAHYAIRYCLGRSTVAVSDGAKWALAYGKRHQLLRSQLCREIAEALKQPNGMMEMDAAAWRLVLQELSDWTLREANNLPWATVDTCPEDTWVETRRDGEEGTNVCALRILRGVQPSGAAFAGVSWEDEPEWIEKYSGRTTVTHHSFAAPTHWRHFNNPCYGVGALTIIK